MRVRDWSPSPTAPENLMAIVAGRPELICLALDGPAELAPALERADVVAIGPGLGRSALGAGTGAADPRMRQAAGGGCGCAEIIAEAGKRRATIGF